MRDALKNRRVVQNKTLKIIYLLIGFAFLILGIIGVLLPFLPGVLFLIIAGYFFARGSRRLGDWMVTNKYFGKYIHNYAHGEGMPLRAKIVTVLLILGSISFAIYYYIRHH